MRHPRWAATAALLLACAGAHAEHFQYAVSLSGTYVQGGTDGCTPEDPSSPECPQPGTLSALMSFDTPSSADGSYSIEATDGDIKNFTVDLGSLSQQPLYGGVDLIGGQPNGFVEVSDGSEKFMFDWATNTVSYSYDYGYHSPNGTFAGTLVAIPEPGTALLMMLGLAGLLRARRR